MSVKTVIVSSRSGVRILYLHSETPGNGGFCTASDKKCPNTIFGKNLIFLRIKRDVFLLSSNTPFFKSIKIIDDNFLVIRMITYLHKTCCHGQKEPPDWTTLSLIKNNKRKIVVNGLCVSSLSVSNDSGIKSSCSCQCKCEW